MEIRVSAQEPGTWPSVYESDPDDKEISDDDDDDRNHKHRRREDARSQSLEDDAMEKVFTKPYRRGSKPFQNGHLYGETGSQSNETWRKYSFNPLEKDISAKFDQKRTGFTQFSRGPSDLNQKIRVNQPFSGDPGAVWGRGRDSGLWNQRDPRFSSIDLASQMVQQGSVPHSLFAGRGLPTASNSRGPSWSAFGLVPGMPNGGLDMLHPLGLQGTFRPATNPSLNMGLPRQRCRDFEEQGFCLRGDTCPMEHGVNRIVVEDVQSLSQFNLPVSLASANLSIAPAGTGPSPATSVPPNTFSNSKGSLGKIVKRGMGDNGLDVSGTFTDSAAAADFYDPDQPLWGNDSHASTGPQSISHQPNVGKNDSLLDPGLSGDHRVGLSDGSDNELVVSTGGTAVGSLSTSSSVRGRISSTKKRTEMGDDVIPKSSPSNFIHSEMMESLVPSNITQDPPHHHKRNNSDSSLKLQSGNGRMLRKPSQKAQRTLFVNGIPRQNNIRESLLSHFQKFGEVIHIYIPLNSQRAFVQFSKREEAEAALMAPDAVMGNRFIKLWWANRDNIPDTETSSGHNMSLPPHGSVSLASPYISVANKRKDDPRSALHHGIPAPVPVSASDHPKPVSANGTKVPPPLQKKLESLEVLKEELRKKQETLDQKRNDFRRKLDKLEKQATGLKGEVALEQVAKKQKLGVSIDSTKAATPSSSDRDTVLPSPQDEVAVNSSKFADPSGLQSSRTLALALQESSSLKSSLLQMTHVGSPVVTNRFKLDNRPTAFKIAPPLPDGLADVAVLKEHFSPCGDVSKVQLEDVEPIEGNAIPKTSKASARIYFTTRHAAEKAFSSSRYWKGHNLQFVWLNSSKDVTRETPSPTSKGNSDSKTTEPVVEISKTTTTTTQEAFTCEGRDVATEAADESKHL